MTLDATDATEAAQSNPPPEEGAPKPEEGGQKPESPETAETDAQQKTEEEKPEGAPERYADFTLPGEMPVDQKALEAFTPLARELNLTQEQAQKLVDVYANQMLDQSGAQREAIDAQVQQWEAAVRDDPEIGKTRFDATVAAANRAMKAFGGEELAALLAETGLGSHPAVVRFCAQVGERIGEPGFVAGGSGAGQKSAADILYPAGG